MCNILVIEKESQIPPAAVLEAVRKFNQDGHGIAWAADGMVHVRRSLDARAPFLDHRFLAKLPRPFLLHFRLATIGEVSEALCHPFTVEPLPDRRAGFKTSGPVLFHNGHMSGIALDMLEAIASDAARLPKGKTQGGQWSDSRILASALAGLTKDKQDRILELLSDGNRFAVLTPRGKVKRYGRWWFDQQDRFHHSSSIYSNQGSYHWGDYWDAWDNEGSCAVVGGKTPAAKHWPLSKTPAVTGKGRHVDYVSAKDGDRVFKSFDQWVAYKEAERLASVGRVDEAAEKLAEAEDAADAAAMDQGAVRDPVEGIADMLEERGARGPDVIDAD